MVDIQFDEEQQYQRPIALEQKSLFIRLVLATKLVSTDRQAGYVLLGVAVLALIISFFLFSSSSRSQKNLTPVQQAQVADMPVNR